MGLTVLYFAKARQIMGSSREAFDLYPNVQELLDRIVQVHPSLASVLSTCAVAVNERYADRNQALKDGDTIAIIPPVSGG
jgi:molybdopterin synthase sulfur carrier subunit